MSWEEHFEQEYFSSWHKEGLPDFHNYIDQYIELREHKNHGSEWIKEIHEILPGISGAQLYSVYGFGIVTAHILCQLLNLEINKLKAPIDWCGRLNLGISLFDYICDVEKGHNRLVNLSTFREFISHKNLKPASTDAELVLDKIARSVIDDVLRLETEDSGLLQLLKNMFEAELLISSLHIQDPYNYKVIEDALFQKSAVPFRIMSEYLIITSGIQDNKALTRRVGDVIGNFYWMIDDARDVWEDLESGHWNYIILNTHRWVHASVTPSVDDQLRHTLSENWKEENVVASIINKTIQELKILLKDMDIIDLKKETALGILGASLWQWWKY
jgi:hypothetical protein